MKTSLLILAGFALCGFAPQDPPLIDDWAQTPTLKQMQAIVPWPPADAQVATLRCTLGAQGELNDCSVQDEHAGPGFDEQALKLAAFYRANLGGDGPQPGATVRASVFVGPSVVFQPEWISRPSADQLNKAFPPRAAKFGKSGGAVIQCEVGASGEMTHCTVKEEAPKSYGFGEAALSLAPYFRLKMEKGSRHYADGYEEPLTLEGVVMTVPIYFEIGPR